MEMPEGWKRLNSALGNLSNLPKDPIRTGTALLFRIEEEKRITELSTIVDLMKEMAEALEPYAGYEDDPAIRGSAYLALKKFKEWK